MNYCKRLESIVLALARKHGLDVNASEASLTLELPPYSPFYVELQGEPSNMALVAHYHEHDGEAVPDPELWLARKPEGWVPVQLTQGAVTQRGNMGFYDVGPEDGTTEMAEVLSFAEEWAEEIERRYLRSDAARAAGACGR